MLRPLPFGLSLLATLSVATQAPEGRAGPDHLDAVFRLGFPGEGDVVNVGTLMVAELDPRVPRRFVEGVEFQLSRDGRRFAPILEPAPVGMAEYAGLWDAGSLPGGDYFLRARLVTRLGKLPTAPIRVHVNAQPLAAARAEPADWQRDPFRVRLDGSASRDPDGQVTGHLWDFEDGTVEPGAVVEHSYPQLGTYPLGLTVSDDRGGEGAEHLLITLGQDGGGRLTTTLRKKEQCGCKEMTVESSGPIVGPAGFEFNGTHIPGIPKGEKGNLGPYGGAKGDQLDLTKVSFEVRSRFEVVAQLTEPSDPALCAEGQRRQSTLHVGGMDVTMSGFKTSDPRYDSAKHGDDPYDPNDGSGFADRERSDCGYDSPDWCDDDYHGGKDSSGKGRSGYAPPNTTKKKHEKQERIVWIDAPGFSPLGRDGLAPDGATFKAKFEAKVTGGGGDCKCSWEVVISIDKDGKVLENKVHKIECTP